MVSYYLPREIQEAFQVIDCEFNEAIAHGVDHVNESALSNAWEVASNWRQMAIIWLIRKTGQHLARENTSREQVLKNLCDIAFKFFGRRYIATTFDIYLIMQTGGLPAKILEETDNKVSDSSTFHGNAIQFIQEIVEIARSSRYASVEKLDAMIMGLTGMHYYYPDKLIVSPTHEISREAI